MTEYLISLFADMSVGLKYFMTFIISMLPIVELRGAVPVGTALGLNTCLVLLISVIGNMLPIPFVLLFARKILKLLKRIRLFARFADFLEKKAEKNAGRIVNAERLGLFLFVAIPLPGTGAWTGALIASLFDLRLKNSLPAIFLGVIVAGLIMTVGSQFVSFLISLI